MKNKRIWISLLLTVFINILFLPLWTEYDYSGFVRTLFNKEARLDFVYFGKTIRVEPFQYKVTPQPFYNVSLSSKHTLPMIYPIFGVYGFSDIKGLSSFSKCKKILEKINTVVG